jgi:hypothetical protein
MGVVCHLRGKCEVHAEVWCGHLKDRQQLEKLGEEGKIMLNGL